MHKQILSSSEIIMAVEERVLEVSGEDVEKAIEKGLTQLGLGRDEVTIEILDEGSSGFLGIGGRDARIGHARVGRIGDPRDRDVATSHRVVAEVAQHLQLPSCVLSTTRATLHRR